MMYVALLLMFVSGILVGLVIKNVKPNILDINKDGKVNIEDAKVALDVNNDGKIDQKDLDIAKTKMKKAASTVQSIATQVKKK